MAGYDEAGLVSTTKHFPGHGSVTADSHETLPTLGASLDDLRARDLLPFEAAVAAGAPAMMMAHLDVAALQPGLPSSQAPEGLRLPAATTSASRASPSPTRSAWARH